VIKLNNISRLYRARAEAPGGSIHALDEFSLSVDAGEWVSIMGPSGSGKSTLVNLIGCLDRPTTGEIWLDGQDVARISAVELNRVRAEKIGFVFQQFHLIPYLTAVENVMLAQYFHSMTDEKEALEALERVGLKDRPHHLPSQLSGGEQQRVCIARALINDPKIILADEPTGNLDAKNEEIVLQLLRDFHHQGRTIVMVTHDPVVARLADPVSNCITARSLLRKSLLWQTRSSSTRFSKNSGFSKSTANGRSWDAWTFTAPCQSVLRSRRWSIWGW